MRHHLKNTAEKLGLPFGDRDKTFNSRLAQELGLWAESKNMGDEFHKAAFKAYFVDGKNIAKIQVLLDLAESANLPRNEARRVIETRAFKPEVDADWTLSREKGIRAVPSFIIDDRRVVGAQPYETLVQLLENSGVKKRTTSEIAGG
jgi:predicted DsbA family dithiol-disulfide isomerase